MHASKGIFVLKHAKANAEQSLDVLRRELELTVKWKSVQALSKGMLNI